MGSWGLVALSFTSSSRKRRKTHSIMLRTVLILAVLQGCLGEWVDICKDGLSTPNDCCHLNTKGATGNDDPIDGGMQGHTYKIVYDLNTFSGQSQNCKFEGISDQDHGYQLVTFETRREHNCVMKWLVKEKGALGPFFIGLKADSGEDMKNLFEWDTTSSTSIAVDPETPTFFNWTPGSPSGAGECVSTSVGPDLAGNAQWKDEPCTTLLPTICEKYPKKPVAP